MIKYLLLLSLLLNFLHAERLGMNEKLGNYIPLDLKFINEDSKLVTLRELMDGKPTLLTLNYFKCAGICSPQLNDMAKTLSRLHLAENMDYKVITVDFSETETPAMAIKKKKNLLHSMNRAYVADAWHFVIGENNSSGKLAQSVGFDYKEKLMPSGDIGYIHPATLIALSPKGKIIRYMSGIEQLPTDVELALIEAKKGEVSPTIAKDSPFCFTDKPKGDVYMAEGGRVWAILVLSVLAGFLIYLVKTSKIRKNN